MKRVSFVCAVLVLVSLLVCPALAVDVGDGNSETEPVLPLEAESSPQVVSIDPQSIEDIVGAFDAAQSARDDLSDNTEPSIPVVELSPDSVESLAEAVGSVLADAASPEVAVNSAGSVSGGYYFVCDCALGRNVKFWVPADFRADSLAVADGGLINMTNSSIYLMPDSASLSDYTIYASRFSGFQYRRNSTGSIYQDLAVSNISETNISFLQDTVQALPESTYWVVLVAILVLGFLLLAFIKR